MTGRSRITLSALLGVFAALEVSAPASARDLALTGLASASSMKRSLERFAPARANDGDSATRWSSASARSQWWQVDLGANSTIDRIELNWQSAYASRYRIRTRRSGSKAWSTAAVVSIRSPGLKVHTFAARRARYVRIRSRRRATPYGISLWDARVCSMNSCAPAAPRSTPTPTLGPTPRPTPAPAPTPSPPTATPAPAPSPGPAELALEPVDGGSGYYAQFSNSFPVAPGFFPLAVWFEGVYNQAEIDLDKNAGLNTYVVLTGGSNLSLIRANGMHTVSGADPANAANFLSDEVDMTEGDQAGCNTVMAQHDERSKPNRATWANFGKGVTFWQPDSIAACYVEAPSIPSVDLYWMSDEDLCQWHQGGRFLLGQDVNLTPAQCRRAANYGAAVDDMRRLDARDGARKPIWNFVEVGCPMGSVNSRCIQPPEIRAAVWHSIIAGARGITYFNHSFSGSCRTQHALREPCYANARAVVKSTNQQIHQLAPVLNADTVTSGTTTSSGVRALYKWHDDHFYVFAGNRENVSTTGSMGLSCVGDATAVKLGEDGERIPVVAGTFTDEFADGNAIHIYRIEGGSRCGL